MASSSSSSSPHGNSSSSSALELLEALKLNLTLFLNALTSPSSTAGTELQQALHTDQKLPDKHLSTVASDTSNLLHQAERLLQPGHLILADHFLGYTSTKCLSTAVALKVPDHLASSSSSSSSSLSSASSSSSGLTLSELAEAANARPDRLAQILRPLYAAGIFTYNKATDTYANNHVSTLLRSDHWTQWHNWVDLYGTQFYDIARGIPKSCAKDAVRWGAQVNYDTDDDMFTYFQAQGWLPQLHRTLGGGAIAQAPGILEDYDWGDVADQTVLDIGGGGGALIASLLRKHKTMKGGVYDLPSVIEHIIPFFRAGGQFEDLEGQVPTTNLIAGNFLESVPQMSVYTMKWVLHDWKDEDSLKILKNIRRAIVVGVGEGVGEGEGKGKSRLVVLESVLSDDHMGRLSRYGDINMMMTANGQERTEKQWRELAEMAGWRIAGFFHLRNAWVQAIEMRPI